MVLDTNIVNDLIGKAVICDIQHQHNSVVADCILPHVFLRVYSVVAKRFYGDLVTNFDEGMLKVVHVLVKAVIFFFET